MRHLHHAIPGLASSARLALIFVRPQTMRCLAFDISGLLSGLAASGFIRLAHTIQAEVSAAGPDPCGRLAALGEGHVGFARAHPGLFQLMFRPERLDRSSPALSTAGAAAFALLTQDDSQAATGDAPGDFRRLVAATSRWSLMHGLATLLIDGRIGAMADAVPGAHLEALVQEVLTCLVRR